MGRTLWIGLLTAAAVPLMGGPPSHISRNSIVGPPPVGASGRAPLGASGPAPLGAAGPAPGIPVMLRRRPGTGTRDRGERRTLPFIGTSFLPYYDLESDPGAPAQPVSDPKTYGTGERELLDQVARLRAEVRHLRAETQPPQPPVLAPDAQETQPAGPPLTLVLRSGETLAVSNFAVMGDTLWDLGKQPVRKIPVSNIDVPASRKASEAAGADFPL